MTSYPLDKPSYFLFQDSASEVSYGKNMYYEYEYENMNKMANFNLVEIHILLPFYLILTRVPISL